MSSDELYKKYLILRQRITLSDDVFWLPLYKGQLINEVKQLAFEQSGFTKKEFNQVLNYAKYNILCKSESQDFFNQINNPEKYNKKHKQNQRLIEFSPGFFNEYWAEIKQNDLMKLLKITGKPVLPVNPLSFFSIESLKTLVFTVILSAIGFLEVLFVLYLYLSVRFGLTFLPLYNEIYVQDLIIPFSIMNTTIFVVLLQTGLVIRKTRHSHSVAYLGPRNHWWKKLRFYHPFFGTLIYKFIFLLGFIVFMLPVFLLLLCFVLGFCYLLFIIFNPT